LILFLTALLETEKFRMEDLYIIGTGSQGRYVIEMCRRDRHFLVKGFVDIFNVENVGKVINGVHVLGLLADIENIVDKSIKVVVAIGKPQEKEAIVKGLTEKGYRFASVISDSAYVSDHVQIGEGVIICQRAVIQPNAKIGNHVIIHTNCDVEHDNVLEDYVNLAPGVCTGGNVHIGRGAFLGVGANVIPKKRIGNYAIVGAGAVVIRDVPDNTTVVGVPAQPLVKNG
jgi:sugar O-acyltransferase (sialic acid O-acetyltransferase NeuD family)